MSTLRESWIVLNQHHLHNKIYTAIFLITRDAVQEFEV